jgi:polyisoprenoid-binding protein YceI
MKLASLLTGVVVAFISTFAMSAEYEIDVTGQHAFINFKVSHLGYSYIFGRFNKFEGNFTQDADNPSASKVSVTIDTDSLDTNHAERDGHLRGADFLDVGSHPTITFESTAYSGDGSRGQLEGNLTMHGVTKSIEIEVHHIGEGDDPWGGYRSGYSGTVDLNASDFGLPAWVGVLQVELSIEGTRK